MINNSKYFIVGIFTLCCILIAQISAGQSLEVCKGRFYESLSSAINEFYKYESINVSITDNISFNSLLSGEGVVPNKVEDMADGIYSFNLVASAIDYFFLIKKNNCVELYRDNSVIATLEVFTKHFKQKGYPRSDRIKILKNMVLILELDYLDSEH